MKKIYPGDPTVKLPFAPKITTNNWKKFPLFRLCQDWFGTLPGFVVRVEMTPVKSIVGTTDTESETKNSHIDNNQEGRTDTFNCTYWIRTDKKDECLFESLKKSPPRGLQM